MTLHVASDKVPEVYSRFRGDQNAAVGRVIDSHLNEKIKVVFGQYAEAQANADAVRFRGQADADAIKARGAADASAIRAKGEALGGNPQLVPLIQAQRWDGKLPVTMVPGGATPMLSLGR